MTANPNYKPSEGKREEFRKYLEKNGIMDGLTKVLVNLYEEVDKPEHALQYLIDKLSIQVGRETHEALQAKLLEAETRIKELQEQIEARAESNQPIEESEAEAIVPEESVPADHPPTDATDA